MPDSWNVMEQCLAELLAEVTGIAAETFLAQAEFDELGIDSITINLFNARLAERVPGVTKTLLFDCHCLADVVGHLARHHHAATLAGWRRAAPAATGVPAPVEAADGWPVLRARTAGDISASADATTTADADTDADSIAIVGLAGRYPDADDVAAFWRNLAAGTNSVREIPAPRWPIAGFYEADEGAGQRGRSYCKWGAFLDGVDGFDADFFGIAPREAETMDPQERLFLEVAWQALEDAGLQLYRSRHGADAQSGFPVAVYVGTTTQSHQLAGPALWQRGQAVFPTSLPWSIANRVSYLLNLRGPSMPVDTACSASLTALHLACAGLRRGEAEMALVGGVNLYLHPSKFVWLSQQRMLTATGQCHAFSDDADGFVPGEGVGAVVLKPLRAALRDGNRIWGLVRATGVNHGGKSNGYTVPTPSAQAALIRATLRDGRVAPASIGYVEAHGTGTRLGDPVEIDGLTRAFADSASDRGEPPPAAASCAIASTKTNIGHLESAAGIAGLTRILLQLDASQLAPLLNFRRLNPNIDLARTPFRLQTTLADWPLPPAGGPRRAAISSFGAGGANAHAVIEEYRAPAAGGISADSRAAHGDRAGANDRRLPPLALFPLSARSVGALRARAAQLAAAIDAGTIGDDQLAALAGTLQLAREPMAARLIVAATDCASLRAALSSYVAHTAGDVTAAAAAIAIPGLDAAVVRRARPGPALAAPATPAQVVAAWLDGTAIDWASWWHGAPTPLLSLPPYPFEHEDFSLDRHLAADRRAAPFAWTGIAADAASAAPATVATGPARLQLTASDTVAINLDASAFFLVDHLIHGEAVLPATAYLELVRAGAGLALGRPVAAIRNAGFGRPYRPGRDGALSLHLDTTGAGQRSFELRSRPDDGSAARVHARGQLRLGDAAPDALAADLLATDMPAASASAADTTPPAAVLGHDEIYRRFRACGFGYGPAFAPLRELRLGAGSARATLDLGAADWQRGAGCGWHPGLLDACLQAIVPLLVLGGARPDTTFVPFAIGALDITGDLREASQLELRARGSGRAAALTHHDVWLRRADGSLVGAMRDIVLREIDTGADRLRYLRPVWRARPLPAADALGAEFQPRLVGADDHANAATGWRAAFAAHGVTSAPSTSTNTGTTATAPQALILLGALTATTARFDDLRAARHAGLETVWETSRAALAEAAGRPLLFVFGYWADGSAQECAHAAVIGFALTLKRENPAATVKLVGLPPAWSADRARCAQVLLDECRIDTAQPALLRHTADGRREVECLDALPDDAGDDSHPARALAAPVRDGGTYLVTGGAGGLGLDFARWIAGAARGTNLVLCGRRPADAAIERALAGLRALGASAHYRATDIGDRDQVRALVADCRARFGGIDGVLHAAGTLRDAFVLRKNLADIDAVCRPKVDGSVWLDLELADQPLDWFVLFASLAGVLGNVGQADYAYANAFMDRFAHWRETEVRAGRRHGCTVAIDWPLWHDGGMQVDAATQARHRALGVATVGHAEGMAMFAHCLAAARARAIDGSIFPLRVTREAEAGFTADLGPLAAPGATGGARPANTTANTATVTTTIAADGAGMRPGTQPDTRPGTDAAGLRDALFDHLRRLLADATGRQPARINAGTSFPDLGLDSIMVMELSAALDADFSNLSRTLFFECDNLEEVAARLLADHADDVARRFGNAAAPTEIADAAGTAEAPMAHSVDAAPAAPVAPHGIAAAAAPIEATPTPTPAAVAITAPAARADIAIVGVAGRYPGADTLAEFWTLLANGVDAVIEVPAERWTLPPTDPAAGPRDKRGDYARWGSFLNDVDRFDPLFFGIAPREAERMDPQERLFLETAWHAVENAGYTPAALQQPFAGSGARRRVGVYAGVMYGEYQFLGVEAQARGQSGLSMSSYASIANRVSYCLDFDGPSMAIDTMCSSSLTAIHLACEAIRGGSCDAAIAGGVNLSLHPYKYRTLSELKFASTDGRCRSFGADGDGYVPGEGVGAVLLKPLAAALADGDRVLAVIKGSAINHGGRGNGYTVPNPNAQGRLVGAALERAGVAARAVNYIEAHGTGTPLGDPIEVRGLAQAFRDHGDAAPVCALGSLKSNLGHLESAAGIAALTKVLLQLEHRTLVPTLHAEPANPNIRFAETPFRVQTTLAPWDAPTDAAGRPLARCAGISSFGAGGSNAHLIVQEFAAPPATVADAIADPAGDELFVFSAGNAELLREQVGDFADWLGSTAAPDLRAAAITLRAARIPRPQRLAVIAADAATLLARLDAWLGATEAPLAGGFASRVDDAVRADARLPADIAGLSGVALEQAARAWAGGQLDWDRPAAPFRRLALPGTRFARRRCWIDVAPAAPVAATAIAPVPASVPVPTPTPAHTPAELLALVREGRLDPRHAIDLLRAMSAAGTRSHPVAALG